MAEQWEVCLVNREGLHQYPDASWDVRYEAKAITASGTAVILTSATVDKAINNFGTVAGKGPMLAEAYDSVIERLLRRRVQS